MAGALSYFLNSGFVLPGLLLLSVPIIIHLLSRLRYRKVRFAAMEFLLQSDELNRRRLIIEQLLLLLLRVLSVLLIVLLLARLLLNRSHLLLLQGATTHHVLIIDDSLSMQQRDGDASVFDRALATVTGMVSQEGGVSGLMHITVLTTSQPDRPLVSDRLLNNALLQELAPRLRNLRCSWLAVSPLKALQTAENILSGDGGVTPQVHVITDLRASDWNDRPEIVSALKALNDLEAEIRLVSLVSEPAANVALTELTAETLSAPAGIPYRMNLKFHNYGTQRSSGLRATVLVDGQALPLKVLVPDIEPAADAVLSHDIVFDSAGGHDVEVRLEEDSLLPDNSRFLAIDVTARRLVLVVDDESQQSDAAFVADALGDSEFTGVSTEIRTSDALLNADLNEYDCIYLLNVRELPADATVLLTNYVRAGGGIAWFPDQQANTTWYHTALQSAATPLFPVQLATVAEIPATARDVDPAFQHPVFAQHPIFAVFNLPDSPFASLIQVSKWFRVAEQNDNEASLPEADVSGKVQVPVVLARLTNGEPIVFEHAVGQGRVLTFLTTAGRRWSNWPVIPPAYVVMHALIHQYLQKPSERVRLAEVGDPLKLTWPVSRYSDVLEVFLPEVPDQGAEEQASGDAETFLRLQAVPVGVEEELTPNAKPVDEDQLTVSVPQANRPGVYRLKRYPLGADSEEFRLAMSVSLTESDLTPADAARIERQAGLSRLKVIDAAVAGGLTAGDAGREVRWALLGLLILVLIAEQLLSLRMSHHAGVAS
ncbi:MAG: BatA and WFA domain-containing protein [Planctomycetaceae bacterium]